MWDIVSNFVAFLENLNFKMILVGDLKKRKLRYTFDQLSKLDFYLKAQPEIQYFRSL